MWTDFPLKSVQQPEEKQKRQTLAGQPLFPVSNVLICPAPLWFHYIPAGDTNQVTGGKTSPVWARQVTVGSEGRLGIMILYGFFCRDPLPVINYHLQWAHNVIYRALWDRGLAEGDHVMLFENKGHLGRMPWDCAVKHNFTTTMMNVCSHRNGNGVYSEPKRIYEPFGFAKACQCPWLTFINQWGHPSFNLL